MKIPMPVSPRCAIAIQAELGVSRGSGIVPATRERIKFAKSLRSRRLSSVGRPIPHVRVESSIANKIDPLGQTWRQPRPMGNRRLPIKGHQPRS